MEWPTYCNLANALRWDRVERVRTYWRTSQRGRVVHLRAVDRSAWRPTSTASAASQVFVALTYRTVSVPHLQFNSAALSAPHKQTNVVTYLHNARAGFNPNDAQVYTVRSKKNEVFTSQHGFWKSACRRILERRRQVKSRWQHKHRNKHNIINSSDADSDAIRSQKCQKTSAEQWALDVNQEKL